MHMVLNVYVKKGVPTAPGLSAEAVRVVAGMKGSISLSLKLQAWIVNYKIFICMKNIATLISNIANVCKISYASVQQHVNRTLTVRNWIIGAYIVEFEQKGKLKADFGTKLLNVLARQLKRKRLTGMGDRALRNFRQFYLMYPEFRRTLSAELGLPVSAQLPIRRTVSAKLKSSSTAVNTHRWSETLLAKLTYSHFLELLPVDNADARRFYEIQAIQNNWSVRELQRAVETLLYQRTGASKNKKRVVAAVKSKSLTTDDSPFRSPYILDFLGLEQKSEFTEIDLEQSIITHIQKFLMELGRGFCFEARQKRITFDNHHYYIDLVFYHRILKCHILVDLKIGAFDHADAGQMNMYLNYFNEEEKHDGDAPPIGIILCAQKNDTLVKYTTHGLSQKVFVGKYLVQLPSEKDLKKLIRQETIAFNNKNK